MNISFSETFKKVTSVALIFGLVFSTLTPAAFAAVVPTFVATETIASEAVGATAETVTHTDITANVSEVKATRTIDVQSLPANSSTIKVGTCTITFQNISGSTSDELDCSDESATIDRNTGVGNNPRTASTTAGRIRALTNIGSSNHGTLVVSGTGTEAIFTTSTSFIENTASVIGFSGTAAGVSIVSTNSVTSVIPVKQETSITIGGTIDIGDTFTVSSGPFGTANFVATTTSTSDVATGLNAAIQAHPNYSTRNYTTSVAGSVITLTAKTAGISFTTLTPTTTNFPGVAQVVTFTPAGVVSGMNFIATINGSDFTGTTTTLASTVATVTANLAPLIVAAGVTCVDNSTHVTCTANVPGVPFTYGSDLNDVEKPVITLNGSTPVTVQVFGAYSDAGATVTDNYYSGLSVNTSGSVDTNTVGSYSINYNVTDGSGNIAEQVVRVVNVVDQENPSTTDNVPSAWQTADATITLTCTDNVGCDKAYYTTDGNDPTILSSYVDAGSSWQFMVTTEGQFVVKYFGIDAVNQETVKTATNTLKIDKTAPNTVSVSSTSDNADSSYAKTGDTITVSFTTSEPVSTPTATIAGKTATVTNVIGNDYTATHTLTAIETQGVAGIVINFSDVAGNSGTYTGDSTVTIDTIAPIISNLSSGSPAINSADISWLTNENTTSQVEYGISDIYGTFSSINPSFVLNHNVAISSLTENTKYYYRVISEDASGNKTISLGEYFTTGTSQERTGSVGGGGPYPEEIQNGNTNSVPVPNPGPTPTPTQPTTPTETTPTEPTPTTPTEPTNPENTEPVDNTVPTPTPIPEPTPTTPTTGGGTGGTTGGTPAPAFNPADATLDIGGAGTPEEEPVVEEVVPAVDPTLDAGGGVIPEETSYTFLWTLLALIALLNTWWFFVAKNKNQPTHRRD